MSLSAPSLSEVLMVFGAFAFQWRFEIIRPFLIVNYQQLFLFIQYELNKKKIDNFE